MKVVFDSNVIIAAFATKGLCQSVFEAAVKNCEVIISKEIIAEFKTKLLSKFKMPHDGVADYIEYLKEFCYERTFKESKKICRDEKDNHVLWLAESTKAEYLVTGDEDLKVLKKHQDTLIISPRDFWFILRGKGQRNKVEESAGKYKVKKKRKKRSFRR